MDYDGVLKELEKVTSGDGVEASDNGKPNVKYAESVVVDEKTFKDRFLFGVVNRGGTVLPFKNGKGLSITKKGDWVTIQILDAGCGRSVQKQSPNFSKKPKQKTETVEVKGAQGTVDAFGGVQ